MQAVQQDLVGRVAKIRQNLGQGFAPIVDLVYPPRCPGCGEGVGEHGGLCGECWAGLAIPTEPQCRSCQRPFGQNAPDALSICAPCLATPPAHDGIAAGTLYTDVSRKLVLSLKHGRRIGLASLMARLMAARVPPLSEGRRLIVPVPLHRWRLWQRGFNQAVLLARGLEKAGCGELLVDGLQRRKRTPSLGGKGAKARARILSGAIAVARPNAVCERDILLVDDVLTSGATSEACVKSLKCAGAKTVVVACFARVLDEALDRTA